MAGYAPRRGLDALSNIDDWMAQRNADLHRLANGADAAGRDAWARGTRAGQDVLAQTTAQVKALGARVMDGGDVRARTRGGRPSTSPKEPGFGRQAVDQFLAGARGAQDAFTMGLGDRGYAGGGALIDAAQGQDIGSAFHRRMDIERARDKFDQEHYGAARMTGQVAGAIAQLPALGVLEGPAVGVRMAESAPLLFREGASVAGAGAAFGMGAQTVSDIARRRMGSFGDYVGAGVGGSIGAVASLFGPSRYAGALDGATTSVVQDVFNGRLPSVSRALDASQTAGILGAGAGRGGTKWADGLGAEKRGVRGEAQAKGDLGENLSRLRLIARGDPAVPGPKSRAYLSGGGYTYPDLITGLGKPIESKFGRAAELSKRQRQAYQQPLDNYAVFNFIPSDVGAVAAHPASLFGAQTALSRDANEQF